MTIQKKFQVYQSEKLMSTSFNGGGVGSVCCLCVLCFQLNFEFRWMLFDSFGIREVSQ